MVLGTELVSDVLVSSKVKMGICYLAMIAHWNI